MPSSITQPLHDGKEVSFAEFAWRCARLLMPLITMKEDPLEALPPEEGFLPDTAHDEEALKGLRDSLATLQNSSAEDLLAWMRREHMQEVASVAEMNRENAAQRERYIAMLAKVEAWHPPTSDHESLKRAMREQLEQDLHFMDELVPPPMSDFDEWLLRKDRDLRLGIARRENDIETEQKRTAWNNEWVRTLRASIPYPDKK